MSRPREALAVRAIRLEAAKDIAVKLQCYKDKWNSGGLFHLREKTAPAGAFTPA